MRPDAKGQAMNSWLQAMKKWSQWLLGDAPMPDGRSKVLLAGTVATAAIVAVGVPAALPSGTSADAVSHGSTSSSRGAGAQDPPASIPNSGVVVASGGSTSTTTTTKVHRHKHRRRGTAST